jgi:hypothetical protein
LVVGDDDMDVIEGNGFLNMAMHTLAQGRQGHTITAPINENRPLTATAGKIILLSLKISYNIISL